MDAVYYIALLLLTFGLPALAVAIIFYLIKPHRLNEKAFIKTSLSRKRILGVGAISMFVAIIGFSGVMAATEPASVRQQRLAEQQATEQRVSQQRKADAAERERLRLLEAQKPHVKTETKAESIPFESTTREDASLTKGITRVEVEGVNGERMITYEVITVDGQETGRKEVKNEVTKTPITKVTVVGTYVQPVYIAPSSSSGNGYTNSQGNYVQSPSSNPAGASAQCRDGTYSYSQSRRGTCSHHGGVAVWL